MRIRQGNARDWSFIYSLGKINIPDSVSPWRKQPMQEVMHFRENVLKGFWNWIQQTGSVIFIAEEENTPLGYLVLHPSMREELSGVIQGWVMDFAVLSEQQGQGIGTQLLRTAEEYCIEHDISYLGLACSTHNISALRLYEKSGFVEERKIMVKCL